MGGGACLGGSIANCVIKVAEVVSLHRSTIFQVLFYGSAASGAGLFLIGECE